MNILVLTIPVTVTLVIFFILVFVSAVRAGEFDDLETPALAPLSDDEQAEQQQSKKEGETSHG